MQTEKRHSGQYRHRSLGHAQKPMRQRQNPEARGQKAALADLVGKPPGRPGRGGIYKVHHRQNQRGKCQAQTRVRRLEDQEGLGHPRQGQHQTNAGHRPEGRAKCCQAGAIKAGARRPGLGLVGGFTHTKDQASQRQNRRDHRQGEDQPKTAGHQPQKADRQKRPGEGADGVHRLAQTERLAPPIRGRDIGQKRIARRAANAFTNAVDNPRGKDRHRARRKREDRLGQRRETVAKKRQRFAAPEMVGKRT